MDKTIAVTAKNITSKAVAELSLNEIIFQLAGKGKMTNAEIKELLAKAKRKITDSSLAWYASKARAGVRR